MFAPFKALLRKITGQVKNITNFLTVYKRIVQERLKWPQSVGNAAVKQLCLPSRIIYFIYLFYCPENCSFYTQSENSKGKHIFDPGPRTSNKYHEAYVLPRILKVLSSEMDPADRTFLKESSRRGFSKIRPSPIE